MADKNLIDIIKKLPEKKIDFLVDIVKRTDGNIFVASKYQERLCKQYDISRPTYFRWLGSLVETNCIIRLTHGVYELNKEYAEGIYHLVK